MGVIFISHSSRNNAEAIRVRDWLQQNGWGPSQVFLDLSELATGDRWRQRLNQIGHNCDGVIVCLSDDWINSPECVREFTHAESAGKPIFPIIVRRVTGAIPRFITDLQFTDVSSDHAASIGFERLKVALHRARIGPQHFPWPPSDEPDRSPYRGLEALTEKDAAVFFGRDVQIIDGLDSLRRMRDGSERRVLVIAAASGAGKSSFLKAGLLARLNRDTDNFLVLPTMRPGLDALNGSEGLLGSLGLDASSVSPQVLGTHLRALQVDAVQRLAGVTGAFEEPETLSPPSIVLPIDQGEEFFSADNATGSAAIELIAQCIELAQDFAVILTIRSDSLGPLQGHNPLANQLELLNFPALQPAAFKDVIEGPASLTTPPIEIESTLTTQLITDLNRSDALPLLAFTLERLVKEYGDDNLLELSEYTQGLGGVAGAINAAVESALASAIEDPALPESRFELETLAKAAFIPALVQLEEADASPKRRVGKLESDIPKAARPLLKHLASERLVVIKQASSGEPATVEVSHEAVLRHWRALDTWISDERVVLVGLARITRSAKEWGGNEKTLSAHSPDLLVHRGERLAAAETYFQRPDLAHALRGQPAVYLAACRVLEDDVASEAAAAKVREERQARRQRSLQRWIGVSVAAVLAITLLGAGFVLMGQRDLQQSRSLMLSQMSRQAIADGDELSGARLASLSARADWSANPTPEGRAALSHSAQFTRHGVSFQHGDVVHGAVFNFAEDRILTWSFDKTARLWDAETGDQIGPDLQHGDTVLGAIFNAAEDRILTWSFDKTARLWGAETGDQIGPDLQHSDIVRGAAFNAAEDRILTWSNDNTARLWDAKTGDQIGPDLQHGDAIHGAAFNAVGDLILTWSWDNTARLWDAKTGDQIGPDLQNGGTVRGAAFNAAEDRILTWSNDKTARLWDAETGDQIGPDLQHGDTVLGAIFNAAEDRILTWSFDNTARLWDAETGAQVGPDLQHGDAVLGAIFSAAEDLIVTWSFDKTARLWDAETGAQVGPDLQHGDAVLGAIFNAAGDRILTWSLDKTARLWDAKTGNQIGPGLQHSGNVRGAAFTAAEDRILTWSDDKTARLWDAETIAQVGPDLQHGDMVLGAVFNAAGDRILTWSLDNTARLWDAETGAQVGPDLQHGGTVRGARFNSAGNLILTWSDDKTARLWDAETGAQIGPSLQHYSTVRGAVFNAAGDRILTWSLDKTARLWDAETGAQVGPDLQHGDMVLGAVFNAAGDRILTRSFDKTARLWDAETGAQVGPDLQHGGTVRGARFNAAGDRILTRGSDDAARLWDAETGAQIGPSLQHDSAVRGAVFNAAENRILTWSDDKTARLWDAKTGDQIGPDLQHGDMVLGAVFNAAGDRILTWSLDKTARLWDAETGAQVGPDLQHGDMVLGAVFNAAGDRILTRSFDKTARLWDAETGAQVGPDLRHRDIVLGARFNAAENRILTWSDDKTARLWDAETGAQIGHDLRHDGAVQSAVFNAKEDRILTWSDDKTARLWDVAYAMDPRHEVEITSDFCSEKLRGEPRSVIGASARGEILSPRHINTTDIQRAPFLRGREGEDVCNYQEPWYAPITRTVVSWLP